VDRQLDGDTSGNTSYGNRLFVKTLVRFNVFVGRGIDPGPMTLKSLYFPGVHFLNRSTS